MTHFQTRINTIMLPVDVEVPFNKLDWTDGLKSGWYDYRGEYYVLCVEYRGVYRENTIYPRSMYGKGDETTALKHFVQLMVGRIEHLKEYL